MSDKRLGKIVAKGRTADIHAWQDDQTVVKLFHDWFKIESIRRELYRAQQVQVMDFPIPKVGEIVEVIGRNGLTYERVHGENMLANLRANPGLVSTYASRLADLHHQLHALEAQPDILDLHAKLEGKILDAAALPEATKAALIDRLHQLPKGNSVCHGDFHPGNIVVTTQGDSSEVVVDWIDCAFGNPIADVARSTILFLGGITGNETPDPAFEQVVRACHDQYLAHYFEGDVAGKAEYAQWLPIIAGARLNENITSLEPWLLSEAEKIMEA